MLRNNLKLAWRNLVKNKGYTFLNIGGLAIGMAGAILIYFLLQFQLTTDTFHKNHDRIFRVVTDFAAPDNVFHTNGVPHPLGEALRSGFPQIEQVAMIDQITGTISIREPGQAGEKLFDLKGTAGFFEKQIFKILDYKWLAGNQATALLNPYTVVFTDEFSRKLFGSGNPLGRVIVLDHKLDLKVSGIIADYKPNSNFRFDFLISYPTLKHYRDSELSKWGSVSSSTSCLVLLHSKDQSVLVEKLLASVVKKNLKPAQAKGTSFTLQGLNEIRFDPKYGNYSGEVFATSLLVTFGSIGVVLLLTSCINFINLSTAIAGKRAREVGVKKVLGSLPSQLFWQFMVETTLITFIALFIGLFIAFFARPLLDTYFNAQITPGTLFQADFAVFFVALFVVMVLVSGYYPGKILSGFKPIEALKPSAVTGRTRGFPLRKVLVVVQFSISQVLIFGTLIMVSQLDFMRHAELGFKKELIYIVPLKGDPGSSQATLFKMRVHGLPEVKEVSLNSAPPMSGSAGSTNFHYNNSTEEGKFDINMFFADSAYLKTFDLKLVAGHNLRSIDSSGYLVNETWVKKMGIKDPQSVLGRNLETHHLLAPIVGVVKDFHTSSFKDEIPPLFIAPASVNYYMAAIKLKGGNLRATKASIEQIWKAAFPGFIYEGSFFDEQLAKLDEDEENLSSIINGFAVLAIVIGCVGLFGLVSFTALNKTKEIGIRKVLGASSAEIMGKFLLEFGYLIGIAVCISAPIGYWIMHGWLNDFKYRIDVRPSLFIMGILASCLITFITISLRTYRAAIANPVSSLRTE